MSLQQDHAEISTSAAPGFGSCGVAAGFDNRAVLCSPRRSPALRAACGREDMARLKTRALEVLLCVLAGDSNAQIADRLDISVSTVKYHLSRLVQSRQYIFS